MNIREAMSTLVGKANPEAWVLNRLAVLRGELITIRIETKAPGRVYARSNPVRQEIALWERLLH